MSYRVFAPLNNEFVLIGEFDELLDAIAASNAVEGAYVEDKNGLISSIVSE